MNPNDHARVIRSKVTTETVVVSYRVDQLVDLAIQTLLHHGDGLPALQAIDVETMAGRWNNEDGDFTVTGGLSDTGNLTVIRGDSTPTAPVVRIKFTSTRDHDAGRVD